MLNLSPQERRLQKAAVVLLLGLLVEVFCLLGKGPLAFMLFAGLCVLLFLAGICFTCICWLLPHLRSEKTNNPNPVQNAFLYSCVVSHPKKNRVGSPHTLPSARNSLERRYGAARKSGP
jgi:hypothetical protein